MPILQAGAPDNAGREPGRLLHPGNAVLRRAIQENLVSFPSQIPVFSRQARPEMQWKAVLLYFVRGWPLCDIAARFGVGAHRIAKTVDEWATRAIALGYVQVIDPQRFAAWMGMEEQDGAEKREARKPLPEVSRPPLNRVSEESVVGSRDSAWRPYRSLQPASAGVMTALDLAIRRCEDRTGSLYGQAATLLRDLRSAIAVAEDAWTPDANQPGPAPPVPAKELLYAFKS